MRSLATKIARRSKRSARTPNRGLAKVGNRWATSAPPTAEALPVSWTTRMTSATIETASPTNDIACPAHSCTKRTLPKRVFRVLATPAFQIVVLCQRQCYLISSCNMRGASSAGRGEPRTGPHVGLHSLSTLRNLVPRLARTFRRAPPLHGGGQGFESPRLHYRNVDVVIITKQNFLFVWDRGLVHDSSLSSHSANSSTGSNSSVRSPRPTTSPRGAAGRGALDGAATAATARPPRPR